jgi:hypothetical protein
MVTYDARPTTFMPLTTQFEWEKLFSVMGIFDGIDGNDLAPSAPSGGSISIAAGTAIIKGQMWRCDAPQPTPLPGSPGAGTLRTDLLVLQYNRAASTSPAVVQPLIVTGSPAASNPAVPPLVQNPVGTGGTGVWQIPIAQWTVNSTGVISGFKDIRQFSGRTVALMTSTARPNMIYPRLGLETDTGYLLRWNGTAWQNIGPKNQVYNNPAGTKATAKASPGTPLHPGFSFAAGDVANATLGQVAYHIKCGGNGQMSTSYRTGFVFETWAFGIHWGATTAGDVIPLGDRFNWYYDATMIINANGSGILIGALDVTLASATPGNAQSTYVLMDNQPAGTFNDGVAFNLYVAAYLSGSGSGTAGSLTGFAATCERSAN